MYCKHCGAANADDAAFCSNCGGALKEGAAQSTVAQDSSQDKPKGLKRLLLFLSSLLAVLVIVGSIVALYLGGLEFFGIKLLITDFFDFSAEGIVRMTFSNLSNGIELVFSTLLTIVVVYAMTVGLAVQLIVGCVQFAASIVTGKATKVSKTAINAFGIYAVGMLLMYCFNWVEGVEFNTMTKIGLAGGAALICANLVLRLLATGFKWLRLKSLLRIVLSLVVLASGVVIAWFAANPVYVFEEVKMSTMGIFILNCIGLLKGNFSNFKDMLYPLIGFVSVIVLVVTGVELVKTAMKGIGRVADGKKGGSAISNSIGTLLFGAALLVSIYLFADGAKFDLTAPIVILALAAVSLVVSIINKIISRKD